MVEVNGYRLGIVFVRDKFLLCIFLTHIAWLNDCQKVSLISALPIDVTTAR
jgi:hypothetical protein